jgi:hypothetical protein
MLIRCPPKGLTGNVSSHEKAVADYLEHPGQFFSLVAVVCVGIAVYISMKPAFYNLNRSKDIFYNDNNFADYYFHVIKAPQGITRQIETIPGVAKATGRVSEDVALSSQTVKGQPPALSDIRCQWKMK